MSFGAHFIPAAQRTARSDGEDTRVRLLRAALQLFSERGFAQTSVRAIAEAAGTNVAAIAYHFGDKARLYTATFYEPFGSGSDLIPVFADPALTLQQALAAYFGGFLEPLKHDDLVTQSLRLHVRESCWTPPMCGPSSSSASAGPPIWRWSKCCAATWAWPQRTTTCIASPSRWPGWLCRCGPSATRCRLLHRSWRGLGLWTNGWTG